MTPFTVPEQDSLTTEGYVIRHRAFTSERMQALCTRTSQLLADAAARHLAGALPSLDFWTLMHRSPFDALGFWDLSRGSPITLPATAWEPFAMRLGHGLHLVDGDFDAVCRGPELALPLVSSGARSVIQSAVVYKQPHSESVQFGLHQDAWYLSSEPESLMLAFVALDDMDVDNGCLEVVPGSHRLPRQATFRMGPNGFVSVDRRDQGRPPDGAVKLPLARGSVAFLHGRTYHGSAPNRSARPRRALIVHTLGDSPLLPSSWVQPPAGGFASLSVKT